MIIRSKVFKSLKIFIINFFISIALFSVLFVALAQFNPFLTLSLKLHDDYVYTYNKNYDHLYTEEELSRTSYYYLDYEGDETILYLNENGFKAGIPATFNTINILVFPISYNGEISENVKYSIDDFDVYENGVIETSMGRSSIAIDYIVLDDEIGTKEECSFFIYPGNESKEILDIVSTNSTFLSRRGRDIKLAIFDLQSLVGQVLTFVTAIPIIILILSSFSFYSFEMMKDKNFIYVNYLFYRKKSRIKFSCFIEMFIPTIVAYILSSIITYFIFLKTQIILLLFPLALMAIIIFIYSIISTNIIVNQIIKRKGVN